MFKIYFENDMEFTGKSVNGSWNEAPQFPIKQLDYHYTYSTKLTLRGYKSYNHLVEKLGIIGQSSPVLSKILLMGRTETYTDIFIIDLRTRNVSTHKTEIGQEYNNQELTGWKDGILNNPGWDIG